jgi:hypothetical protein
MLIPGTTFSDTDPPPPASETDEIPLLGEPSTLTVSLQVSHDEIESLLISAVEGGSNYWYRELDYDRSKHDCYWKAAFGDGVYMHHSDDYETHPCPFAVTLPRMRWALEEMSRVYPWHFADFVRHNADATTGDVFLQLCVLGELVYG